MSLVCAITGSAGYLGSVTARHFLMRGWRVRGLTRRPGGIQDSNYETHPFELGKEIDPRALKGVSILIHAAYDFKLYSWHDIEKVNVDGSLEILKAAREAGVPQIVFVSSISAFDGCESMYGKSKLAVEKKAAGLVSAIVRPGLVFGPTRGGTFGSMARLAENSAILPLIGWGDQPLNLIHEEDAARALFEVGASNDRYTDPITIAHPRSHTFREVLATVAHKKGKNPTFVPVPVWPMKMALKSAEFIGLKPRLRADSLVSLIHPNLHVDYAPLRRLALDVRPFNSETLN